MHGRALAPLRHIPGLRPAVRRSTAMLKGAERRISTLRIANYVRPLQKHTVLCVYRHRNRSHVARLIDTAVSANWDVRLWALDLAADELVPWTHGTGPGAKFDLCNQLLASRPLDPNASIVVVDDDIRLYGSLDNIVSVTKRAGIDLAQTAHRTPENASHAITVRHPFTIARLTGFVEIGPLFVVAPSIRSAIVPFPSGIGMGWGLEVSWSRLTERGFRLGVLDAVPVDHLDAPGRDYDKEAETLNMHASLGAVGLKSLGQLGGNYGRWALWQRHPPWRQ